MSNPAMWHRASKWLVESGIVKEDEMIRRVIIDIQLDGIVHVYKEGLMDERVFGHPIEFDGFRTFVPDGKGGAIDVTTYGQIT